MTGFPRAENACDWEAYRGYLASDVQSVTYGPEREVVQGREAYVRGVVRMYEGREARFEVASMAADEERGVAFVEVVIEGLRSVNVFHVEDGRIRGQREYLEDGYRRLDPKTAEGT